MCIRDRDAVDGELPLCGGGGDVGGQGGHQAQGADAQQRPGDGQPTLAQEDDLPLFSRFHAKEFHIDPVLSMSFYLYALFSKSCAPISHGMGTGSCLLYTSARYEEDYEENGENRKIVQEEETDQIQLQVVDNVIYASVSYTHLDVYKRQEGFPASAHFLA